MQQPFKDLLTALRAGRHQPYCSCSLCEMYNAERWERACQIAKFIVMGFIVLAVCLVSFKVHGYTLDEYANAIKHAEGNSNYGILAHYKHTSYRQACKNTILHQYRNYVKEGRPGLFLAYLQRHYAPIGVSNDPLGLNINWQRNVLFYLRKG